MTVSRVLTIKIYIAKFLVSLIFCWLVLMLMQECILQADEISKGDDDDGWVLRQEKPIRGTIVDRNGRSLAKSLVSRDIVAVRGCMNPGMIKYVADFISPEIGVNSNEIVNILKNGGFEVKLKSGLSEDEYAAFCKFRKHGWREKIPRFYEERKDIKALFPNYNGFFISFRSTFREIVPRKNSPRCYPAGQAAAQFIGYSSDVQNNFTAWKGIELEYDKILKGVEGDVFERFDAFKRPIPGYEPLERGMIPGWDLRLTIESDIQALAYHVLEERVIDTNAAGGVIIVLDAGTAEVLAMVSYPSFDPLDYQETLKNAPDQPDLLPMDKYRLNPMHNLATQLKFEPGSVMKPIIAAWALREGKITPEDLFEVKPEGLKVPGKKTPIRDTHPPPTKEMWKIRRVLVESSNQGMAQVGMRVGRDSLIEGMQTFGLGQPILGFEEESQGDIRARQNWWPVVQEATTAYGQGVSLTPIQLAAAYNVFANNGCYVKPRIALDRTSPTSEVRCYESNERIQILSSEVMGIMIDALEGVVLEGTGMPAACAGYKVGGKTGTAQKPDRVNHSYFDNRHYASFCGFGPIPEPRYTVLVVLDEPTPKWGGSSCGPAFKAIFESLMLRDGIAPVVEIAEPENENPGQN